MCDICEPFWNSDSFHQTAQSYTILLCVDVFSQLQEEMFRIKSKNKLGCSERAMLVIAKRCVSFYTVSLWFELRFLAWFVTCFSAKCVMLELLVVSRTADF